jgi:clan AA aspartic protease
MEGVVTAALEATLPLHIQDANGQKITVDAVIDTGFTGELALPAAVVDMLSFPLRGVRSAMLGDGRRAMVEVYEAQVLWQGELREVQLLAMEGCLVGMSLLHGNDVHLRVVEGGFVRVAKTPGFPKP